MLPYPATIMDWVLNFALHVVTGVAAVAVHYSIMWAVLKLSPAPLVASGIGFTGGAITRYLLSYFKVFSPTGSVPATVAKYFAALGAQLAANVALLDYLIRVGTPLWGAQVATTILLTFSNYIVYRIWVFR
jgi:putative flippase GtrA